MFVTAFNSIVFLCDCNIQRKIIKSYIIALYRGMLTIMDLLISFSDSASLRRSTGVKHSV